MVADNNLIISTGINRTAKQWRVERTTWPALVERLRDTRRTPETMDEYLKLPKTQQDAIKDVGGFVGGELIGGRRKKGTVKSRCLLTLDADYAKGDFWGDVTLLNDWACCLYSTHRHRPSAPRLRLLVPLSRPVSPDEYKAVARRVAADIGIELFDDTTFEPERLMFWPSTSKDGVYEFKVQEGPMLDPDEVLASYTDWTNPLEWPISSRVGAEQRREVKKQGDPTAKPGMVGAFCRTYDIEAAIETFLQDAYTQCGERYTYTQGSTAGGLVLYDGGAFAYSHHATDPVSGKLVNAFDLVRLHLFGERDDEAEEGTPVVRLPSYTAMLEMCQGDEGVQHTLGEEGLQRAKEEFGDMDDAALEYATRLKRDKHGRILPSIDNVVIIMTNDPRLAKHLCMNELNRLPVKRGVLPWWSAKDAVGGDAWTDGDDAALRHYLEVVYELDKPTKIKDAVLITKDRQRFHPVREYLNGLVWDGVQRCDELLIHTLGAEDTPYVRTVTRKMLVAAVARIMQPGVKFDYMLVLVGPQGIGKSLLIDRLGCGWSTDSLTTVQGKEAYEGVQGFWLVEMPEMTATRKAEVEAVKHFISKREDAYRVAYGHYTEVFPRQCVFIGTTNDREFLKDRTGNRRFWPVDVGRQPTICPSWEYLTPETVGQIWAEAVQLYKDGESLYLDASISAEALRLQEEHTEEDPRVGLIAEYLEKLLPDNWEKCDKAARVGWLNDNEAVGTVRRDRVCIAEIWDELFGGGGKPIPRPMAREMHECMRRIPGWGPYENAGGKQWFKLYGVQRAYVRILP